MLTVPLITQQDSKWKNSFLGTSSYTIGNYGCALACIAVLAGETDLIKVNKLLVNKGAIVNEKGGSDNASLMYWVKVTQAYPRVKFNWRAWSYDNAKVKEWISKGYPVIVEVDATPIGAPRLSHYVVYLGEQKLFDPWTGKIRSTEDFPDPKGYILYEVSKKPQTADEIIDAIDEILQGPGANEDKLTAIKALL